MNLIGYFLRDLLRARLQLPSAQALTRKLDGTVLLNVNGMEVTLVFCDKSVQLHRGEHKPINASITGDLSTVLDVALGAGYLKSVLTGQIKIRGNLLILLKLIRILRVTT